MDNSATNITAQQPEETSSNTGQAGDNDSLTGNVYRNFDSVVEYLAAIDGGFANVFAQLLEDSHPAIEKADAERQLMQLAADVAKRRTDPHRPGGITAARSLPFVCQEGSKMICDTCKHEIDQCDHVICHDCGGVFCSEGCERRHSCVDADDGFGAERGRAEELEEVDADQVGVVFGKEFEIHGDN